MKSDELPAWLKPHLPPAAPRDATATRRSRPTAPPSTLSPEVQRRINNLTATMGRSVGPVTPGNHPVGLSDVANLVGGGVSTALRVAGVPLDRLQEAASARRGNVTEPAPIDFSKMDPRRAAALQLAAMHEGGADEMLAAAAPALPESAMRYKLEWGPNAAVLRDAESLRGDPDLYTAAGPKRYRPSAPPEGAVADSTVANAPAFYSRLERAIQTAPMKKGTSAQWMAHLSKNVSAEERDWTGVDKFLKSTTGPVTQDQVQQVFDAGKIKLGRTTLGGEKSAPHITGDDQSGYRVHVPDLHPDEYTPLSFRSLAQANEFKNHISHNDAGDLVASADHFTDLAQQAQRSQRADLAHQYFSMAEAMTSRAEVADLGRGGSGAAPKFSAYTEPGGTNYRENLTTLGEHPDVAAARAQYEEARRAYNADPVAGRARFEQTGAELSRLTEHEPPSFRSSHFDEPNILLHTRTKDRTAPDGSRVLHAEEIQSDWHQKGRAGGYVPVDVKEQRRAAMKTAQDAQQSYFDRLDEHVKKNNAAGGDINSYNALLANDPELAQMKAQFEQADAALFKLNAGGVPDAPFKKTEDWQLLGVKQLIDDAVRGGYDHVAWTPGQLQADRYSLAKQVDDIHYDPQQGYFVAKKDGINVHTGNYAPEALPSVIGKEAADRLLHPDNTGPNGFQRLSGDDLNIGGSGMKSFYDQMLPKNLNKYFKSLNLGEGTPQLGTTEMTFNKPGELSVQSMPSFPITPALRQMVLTKGQPLLTLMGALGLGGAASMAQDGTNPPQQ